MIEFALEADPGKLTASHPTFTDYDHAALIAESGCMIRDGIPPVRILTRVDGGPWQVADV